MGVALPGAPLKMAEVSFVPRATAAAWLQQSQGEADETRRKSLAAVQGVTAWAEAAVQKTTEHYTVFIQVGGHKGVLPMRWSLRLWTVTGSPGLLGGRGEGRSLPAVGFGSALLAVGFPVALGNASLGIHCRGFSWRASGRRPAPVPARQLHSLCVVCACGTRGCGVHG